MTATTPATTGSANVPATPTPTNVGALYKKIRQNLPDTNKAAFEAETGLYLKGSVDPALRQDHNVTLALLAKHDALLADGKPVTVDSLLDATGQRFAWLREDIKLVHAVKVRLRSSVVSSPFPAKHERAAIVEEWFPKLLDRILEQEYLGSGKPPKPKYTFSPDGTQSGTAGGFHDTAIMKAYFDRFPRPEKTTQVAAKTS